MQVRLEEPRVFASAKWKWLEAQIKLKNIDQLHMILRGTDFPTGNHRKLTPTRQARQANQGTCPKATNLLSGKIEAGVLVHARFELASGEEIEIY